MSRRSILRNHQVLNSANSTIDPSSEWTDISGVDKVSYRIECGSSVDTGLKVFVSNDSDKSSPFELPFESALTVKGSEEQSYIVSIDNYGFKWVQLKFTDNGGSGNISAWITGTTVGA